MVKPAIKFFVGFDTRRPTDYAATVRSILNHTPDAEIFPLLLPDLRAKGYYTRKTLENEGVLFDIISAAPMSTEFAISRFLVPFLCNYEGFAVFVDGDFLFREDISTEVALMPASAAVAVVKHKHVIDETQSKMDGQPQLNYLRKNWSSLIIFNCSHRANRMLTLGVVNSYPGRELHALSWLYDNEIHELSPAWNWLEGYSDALIEPYAVHYTRGTPDVIGYEIPFANEWLVIQESIA